jgi:hypothetical protein
MLFTGSKRRERNRQGTKIAKIGLEKQGGRNPFSEFLPLKFEPPSRSWRLGG